MKDRNICKFSSESRDGELSVISFVLETNLDTMRKRKRLSANRMILITQGKGTFILDGRTFPFSIGTLLFGFEGEDIVLSNGENLQYAYVDFTGVRGITLCHRFGIFPHTRTANGYESLIPFCLDAITRTPSENIDIVGESFLLYALSRLKSEASPDNSIVKRIIEITDEQFRDPEISISMIADVIGYNAKYLSHIFKKRMNMNYSKYLRSIRFKYAISLFELGLSSVKNVALLSGFSDPFYFSNAFKKAIGVSPKDFITQCRENGEKTKL